MDSNESRIAAGTNTTVVSVGFVQPSIITKIGLNAGTYSLNKRSNVPFVSLIGSSGFKKTITWGETCDVPANQLVAVQNASYHAGDIFLNKGLDICNRPSRITVPVDFRNSEYTWQINTGEGPSTLTATAWGCKYPCDTRGAKRAYLTVDALVADMSAVDADTFPKPDPLNPVVAFIRGRKLDGSMQTSNLLSAPVANFPPFGPGVGFLYSIKYAGQAPLTYVPLGNGASPNDDTRPHTLLDAGDVFFISQGANVLQNLMAWPLGQNQILGLYWSDAGVPAAPGMWYVVEYD